MGQLASAIAASLNLEEVPQVVEEAAPTEPGAEPEPETNTDPVSSHSTAASASVGPISINIVVNSGSESAPTPAAQAAPAARRAATADLPYDTEVLRPVGALYDQVALGRFPVGEAAGPDRRWYCVWQLPNSRCVGIHTGLGNRAYTGIVGKAGGFGGRLKWRREGSLQAALTRYEQEANRHSCDGPVPPWVWFW